MTEAAQTVVVGTRASRLATRQTDLVLAVLRRAHPAVTFSVQMIHTTADRHPDRPLTQLPGIGFFVKELEAALLAGEIDAAVHSMKDLPSASSRGLAIAAIAEREDPRDVLVARDGLTLRTLPAGARVGTSSPRRAAYLRAARPDLVVMSIRGNVETRIRKVDAGVVDAVCLAGAGLQRIGLADRITEWLPVEVMLPAPGQGALGVQVRAEDRRAGAIARAADHAPSRAAVQAERAVLARLEGGCRLPVGAFAVTAAGQLALRAAVAAPDGSRIITGETSGPTGDAVRLGTALAEELLARGAAVLSRMAGGP